MAHFAHIIDGIVDKMIVAEQEFIDSCVVGDPSEWIQTSYNTHGGQHPENRPLRYNYAGIGYTYDSVRDAFIPPKPFESWILNESTCLWESPVPFPTDNNQYVWDETTLSWKLISTGEP